MMFHYNLLRWTLSNYFVSKHCLSLQRVFQSIFIFIMRILFAVADYIASICCEYFCNSENSKMCFLDLKYFIANLNTYVAPNVLLCFSLLRCACIMVSDSVFLCKTLQFHLTVNFSFSTCFSFQVKMPNSN